MPLKTLANVRDWSRWQWSLLMLMVGFLFWGSARLLDAWNTPSEEYLQLGQELFLHEWTPGDALSAEGDGLGPVFNAKSCVACHFQGGVGGGGPNEMNVTSFTAFPAPSQDNTEIVSGVIHMDAIIPVRKETHVDLQQEFPVIKGVTRVIDGCTYRDRDFDPLITSTVNTPALFGLGEIDNISGSSIKNSRRWRLLTSMGQELQGNFDNIPAGRARVLPDGRVGKFGWKAQFATLEEFVAAACAVEIGLSNPLRSQDVPHGHRQDNQAGLDLNAHQFRSLVEFCAMLPVPRELPGNTLSDQSDIAHGKQLFSSVGCAACHTPEVDGVAGVYSDFLLYSLEPRDSPGYEDIPEEIPVPIGEPHPSEWKTPPLWGVADSAPYMHDGSASTLEAAIRAHQGDAQIVLDHFSALDPADQKAILTFLKSLKAPIVPKHMPNALASTD